MEHRERVKDFVIDSEHLITLLNASRRIHECITESKANRGQNFEVQIPRLQGVPADALITHFYPSFEWDGFKIRVYHKDYPKVERHVIHEPTHTEVYLELLTFRDGKLVML